MKSVRIFGKLIYGRQSFSQSQSTLERGTGDSEKWLIAIILKQMRIRSTVDRKWCARQRFIIEMGFWWIPTTTEIALDIRGCLSQRRAQMMPFYVIESVPSISKWLHKSPQVTQIELLVGCAPSFFLSHRKLRPNDMRTTRMRNNSSSRYRTIFVRSERS